MAAMVTWSLMAPVQTGWHGRFSVAWRSVTGMEPWVAEAEGQNCHGRLEPVAGTEFARNLGRSHTRSLARSRDLQSTHLPARLVGPGGGEDADTQRNSTAYSAPSWSDPASLKVFHH